MGQGIAQSFAQAGFWVRLVDVREAALERAIAQIDANLRLFQEYGLLEEDPSVIKARIYLTATEDYAREAAICDYIVESVPEVFELKRKIFAQLDACEPRIIIASNTSRYTVASMTEGCATAQRMIGVHYFNPAHIIPLVEIHYGPLTDEGVIAATKALMIRTGKSPVIVKKDVFGLIGIRIQLAMAREIESLLAQDVASPEDIDTVARAACGLHHACIGNLESYDMAGLEATAAVERRIFKELSNGAEPASIPTKRVDHGEPGSNQGRGGSITAIPLRPRSLTVRTGGS